MGALANFRAVGRVIRRTGFRRPPKTVQQLARGLARRPAIAFGVGAFETGLMLSGRVDPRLKELAATKAAGLIGCPF